MFRGVGRGRQSKASKVSKDLCCEREERGKQEGMVKRKQATGQGLEVWDVGNVWRCTPWLTKGAKATNAFMLVPALEGSHYKAWVKCW